MKGKCERGEKCPLKHAPRQNIINRGKDEKKIRRKQTVDTYGKILLVKGDIGKMEKQNEEDQTINGGRFVLVYFMRHLCVS